MSFRTGDFRRDELRGFFQPFCPSRAVSSIEEVSLHGLQIRGKKLILLDVDNTLVDWRRDNFSDSVLGWINEAKSMGMHLALVSNTRHPERLKGLAERLQIPVMPGKFKPSRTMFLNALEQFGVEAKDAVMIGDQLFTDILGANRTGIEAIWVHQRSPKDFIGTKVSRMGERFMRSRLYRVLVEAENPIEGVDVQSNMPAQNSLNTQIFRFLVVGATSFAIDSALRLILIRLLSFNGKLFSFTVGEWLIRTFPQINWGPADKAASPILIFFAALIAMYNSFILNRRWTFEIKTKEERAKQMVKFYVVSMTGLLLNTWISSNLFKGNQAHPTRSLMEATVIAAVVVAAWNFCGQRFFAFRSKEK